jgi:hypothetical protein
VDGDQGDGEPRCRAAGAVEAPGDAVGGQRLREPGRGGQGDAAGGVAEDDPFLAQCPEQAALSTSAGSCGDIPGRQGGARARPHVPGTVC